ncbi:MAG: hypothetical protein H6686_05300 [Fibrobacteria bacterium]|nr:hypothetical protein [Fibrobacteria bacterium]
MGPRLSTLLLLPFLSGCSLLGDLVGRFARLPAPAASPVAPSESLGPDASRLQDSLRPLLQWMAEHPPAEYTPHRLAFRSDSSPLSPPGWVLEITAHDRRRINSYRLTAEATARLEKDRILSERPWESQAVQAGLRQPLELHVTYRHRDYLKPSSRLDEDTLIVRLSDSLARFRGEVLEQAP